MSTKPIYVRAQDGLRALQVKRHSGEKLHYMRRLIDQFCTGTKDRWRHARSYIDLFSGPGMNVYDDDGQEEKSASLEALSHKFPFTKYFINDIDSESVNSLQSRIASLNLGAATQVKVTCSDCNLAVDSIVSSIGRAPCVNLAVLDGFGIECHWSTVKKLASIERIDLVILFPGNMTLVRNAERWSQEENDARLDLFMPDKSWRTVWSDRRLTGGKAAPDFLNLYVNGLTTLHYRRDLIHTKLIKSETGQPLYHLVFASRHPLGAKFWQQAVGRDDAGQTSMLFENI